jgi:hypothetical protein
MQEESRPHKLMERTITLALRTHIVLLSVSAALVTTACLLAVAVLRLPMAGTPPFGLRTALLTLALLLMLGVRLQARRAFDTALRRSLVTSSEVNANGATIADDCPYAWLVQLHVELSPAEARRQLLVS